MADPAIIIKNLTKTYRKGIRNSGTLRGEIERLFKPGRNGQNKFNALEDINLRINRGESIAIIGKNGAGKSTLLKVLSKITKPTLGTIELYGRTSALLEVGTGFHPELTGLENIYLNGSILGMKKREISAQLDAIIDFSGLEGFLDMPVKHYSSGMYVRLAFSVAAHLEPEILIVDEVLAVGDAEFQRKCLGRMDEVTRSGRTVLFVSHNMDAVERLCTRGVVLNRGKLTFDGGIHEAINFYAQANSALSHEAEWTDPNVAPGNDNARLRAVRALDTHHQAKSGFSIDEPIILEFEFEVLKPNSDLFPAFHLRNSTQQTVFVVDGYQRGKRYNFSPGSYKARCVIPGNLLNENKYSVYAIINQLSPSGRDFINHALCDNAISFNIYNPRTDVSKHGLYTNEYPGVVRPLLDWDCQTI